MGFGAEIKRLRNATGYSADLLAKKIGVPKDRYNKWEQRDIEKPKKEDAEKINLLFGMEWQNLIKLDKLPDFQLIPPNQKQTILREETIEITTLKLKSTYVRRFTSLH